MWNYITGEEIERYSHDSSEGILRLQNGDLLLQNRDSLITINTTTGQKDAGTSFMWGSGRIDEFALFDDERVAYGTVKGDIVVFDGKTGTYVQKFGDSKGGSVSALTIYNNRYIIAAYCDWQGKVNVFDAVDNRLINTFYFDRISANDVTVRNLVLLPDNQVALGISFGIKIYDIFTGQEQASLPVRNRRGRMVLGQNGWLYFTTFPLSRARGTVCAWNYQAALNGQVENNLQEIYQDQPLSTMNVLPNGKLVLGDDAGEITLLSPEGNVFKKFKGHENPIYYITPLSGNRVLSCAKNETLFQYLAREGDLEAKVWDIKTQKCIETFIMTMKGAPEIVENANHELITLNHEIIRLERVGDMLRRCSRDEVSLVSRFINEPELKYDDLNDAEKTLYHNNENYIQLIIKQIKKSK